MKKYNHAFTIAFELINESQYAEATNEELFNAIQNRLDNLRKNPDEIQDACDSYDTFEIEEDD